MNKNMDHRGDGDANSNWRPRNNPKILVKGLENLEIRRRVITIQII